ncbi:hypothetical protein TRAPUB_32 [Trametes pubescens]|uniref:Uncharacterized protein n=1 Tax=Trametes pubescens TaxID=154538 RepID=A0A1M2VNB7_TRAPU|nr:hypothetical protein TRAPUB_32 [Trametes pubescens]
MSAAATVITPLVGGDITLATSAQRQCAFCFSLAKDLMTLFIGDVLVYSP